MTNPVTQPDPRIYLDDLSLDDLSCLNNAINALHEAGCEMAAQSYEPSFTVLPGQQLAMRLNYRMLMAKPVGPFGVFAGVYPPPPVVEPVREETVAEHIARDMREGRFPARSARQSIQPTAATVITPPADNGEMEGVLNEVFQAVGMGKGRERDQFDAPRAEPAAPTEQPDIEAAVSAAAVAVLGHDPALAKNAAYRPEASPKGHPDLSAIDSHILSLPTKGGWGIERDRELITLICDGWGTPEIAMEMGLSGRDVTDRFNLLTGLDGTTKTRAFSRDDLLAALTAWSAKPAEAAE